VNLVDMGKVEALEEVASALWHGSVDAMDPDALRLAGERVASLLDGVLERALGIELLYARVVAEVATCEADADAEVAYRLAAMRLASMALHREAEVHKVRAVQSLSAICTMQWYAGAALGGSSGFKLVMDGMDVRDRAGRLSQRLADLRTARDSVHLAVPKPGGSPWGADGNWAESLLQWRSLVIAPATDLESAAFTRAVLTAAPVVILEGPRRAYRLRRHRDRPEQDHEHPRAPASTHPSEQPT
jgi:hypothetical protein